MREIVHFLRINDAYFVLGLSALSLILLVCCISLSAKLSRLNKRRGAKLEEGHVEDILDRLFEQSTALAKLQDQLDTLGTQQAQQAETLSNCLQNVGMVRFDAFDDIGGEQSFSLALLDTKNNGIAFSSLYGRQYTRLYAKAIKNGKSEHPLSNEEQNALKLAVSNRE